MGAVIAGMFGVPIAVFVALAMLIYGCSWTEIGLTSICVVAVCSGVGFSAPVWGVEMISALRDLLTDALE
jgi:hypothetical protein